MSVPGDCVIYEYLQALEYCLQSQFAEYERRYEMRQYDAVDHMEAIILLGKLELYDEMSHTIVNLMRCARNNIDV